MLGLLPRLEVIVFVGRKAASTRERVLGLAPPVRDFEMPHPSPMFVNRAEGRPEAAAQVARERSL